MLELIGMDFAELQGMASKQNIHNDVNLRKCHGMFEPIAK